MIAELTQSAMAPFLEQVGWQGFAYGLLGLKTMKRVIEWGRDLADPTKETSTDNE